MGRRLIDELLRRAAEHGVKAVLLEVRADNQHAQELYRRRGFAEIGRRRGYYQPSGADAYTMRRPRGGASR